MLVSFSLLGDVEWCNRSGIACGGVGHLIHKHGLLEFSLSCRRHSSGLAKNRDYHFGSWDYSGRLRPETKRSVGGVLSKSECWVAASRMDGCSASYFITKILKGLEARFCIFNIREHGQGLENENLTVLSIGSLRLLQVTCWCRRSWPVAKFMNKRVGIRVFVYFVVTSETL